MLPHGGRVTSKGECRRFKDEIWILCRRFCESYPSYSSRAFPVMFCTVNEEFAVSRDGSWRCIHAWERRVPVIWPLVRLKTRQTRKFCPVDAGVTRLPWESGQKKISEGGDRATVGPHIVLSEHADWAIKSLVEASFGEIRETESSLLLPRLESRVKQSRLKYRSRIVRVFLKWQERVLYDAVIW